jgi:uncharacterized protein
MLNGFLVFSIAWREKRREMKIDVSTISAEGLQLDIDIPNDEIDTTDIEETLSSPIHFKGSIVKVGKGYVVSGNIAGKWILQCARCLDKFSLPVIDDFKVFLTRQLSGSDHHVIDLTVDQLDESELIDNQIDLSNIVREQMILHIPIKAICTDNCLGLCPVCGQNKNSSICTCETTSIDPRMVKLKRLFEK